MDVEKTIREWLDGVELKICIDHVLQSQISETRIVISVFYHLGAL